MTGTAITEISPDRWAMLQRMAQAFATSDLVPDQMHGKVANCTVALLLAEQMQENPIMIMQNIYFVHGRPGWITQYMIARANNSGKFRGPLRWRSEGEGDTLAVTCAAKPIDDPDEPVEITISMKTAVESGWTQYYDKERKQWKPQPRWSTPGMAEQMLRWRSASWLIRLYAPEVMFGLPTVDELEDTMKDVTPPKPGIDDFKPGATLREQLQASVENEQDQPQAPPSASAAEAGEPPDSPSGEESATPVRSPAKPKRSSRSRVGDGPAVGSAEEDAGGTVTPPAELTTATEGRERAGEFARRPLLPTVAELLEGLHECAALPAAHAFILGTKIVREAYGPEDLSVWDAALAEHMRALETA